ncbi:rod-binding protein [Sphingobium cloacae]|uniref:Flagellar protein FlgJ n=1 Tax=Sphingobium cloacae TaxID=120107 RepID=A0A1E1F2D1_9SPHN|nr:rod-binding protein [Sphingobium cloacae]BAV64677.1 flagellar protein FlgJ [Sphingobium cloacae]
MQISNVTGTSAPQGGSTDKAALQQAAKQFEAIFLRQMIGAMRSSSQGEGLLDSSASDQFRDMADARTADSMAQKGSLGIAELLLRQFGGNTPSASAPTQDKGA